MKTRPVKNSTTGDHEIRNDLQPTNGHISKFLLRLSRGLFNYKLYKYFTYNAEPIWKHYSDYCAKYVVDNLWNTIADNYLFDPTSQAAECHTTLIIFPPQLIAVKVLSNWARFYAQSTMATAQCKKSMSRLQRSFYHVANDTLRWA